MQNTWLTREQAAVWLNCHPDTVSNIVKEMEQEQLPGIWKEGRFLRIHQQSMSDYLCHRKEYRRQRRAEA